MSRFSCERPDHYTNQFLAKRDFPGSAWREKQPSPLVYPTTPFAVDQPTIVASAHICPFPAEQMGSQHFHVYIDTLAESRHSLSDQGGRLLVKQGWADAETFKRPNVTRTSRCWRESSEDPSDRQTTSRRTGSNSNPHSMTRDDRYLRRQEPKAGGSYTGAIRTVEDC